MDHTGHQLQVITTNVWITAIIDKVDTVTNELHSTARHDHVDVSNSDSWIYCATCSLQVEPEDIGIDDAWSEVRHYG